SENCFVTSGSIPDTTAMSNPKRKPPSAAMAQAHQRILGNLWRCCVVIFYERFHYLGGRPTGIDQRILSYCGWNNECFRVLEYRFFVADPNPYFGTLHQHHHMVGVVGLYCYRIC